MASFAAFALLVSATANAASLQVVFPQSVDASVVQGQQATVTMDVQAFGAIPCDATSAPSVRVDMLYSVDSLGAVAAANPANMPITTGADRGSSNNCYINNPVHVPLTITAAADTPPGDYTGTIMWGKGGDGDVSEVGPPITIHVLPAPVVVPPPPVIIVLPERVTPPKPHPTLGKTLLIQLVSGTVTYQVPGGQPVTLTTSPVVVPNGTLIDATSGHVEVTVVHSKKGGLDHAQAWDGSFTGSQNSANKPVTTFVLTPAAAAGARHVASAASTSRKVSKLWVNAHGNFKTRGKRASAITRGTTWFTEDNGTDTTVSVQHGLVAVRDFVKKKTVLVKTGGTYTARPKKRVLRRVQVFTG